MFAWAQLLLLQAFRTLMPPQLLHAQTPPINCFACNACAAKHRHTLFTFEPFQLVTLDKLTQFGVSFHLSLWVRLVRYCNRGSDPLTGALFVEGGPHGVVPVYDHSLRKLGPLGKSVVEHLSVCLEAVGVVVATCLPEADCLRPWPVWCSSLVGSSHL